MKTKLLISLLAIFILQTKAQETSLNEKIEAGNAGFDALQKAANYIEPKQDQVADKIANGDYKYENYTYTGEEKRVNLLTNQVVQRERSYKAINTFYISSYSRNEKGIFLTITRYIDGPANQFCNSTTKEWNVKLDIKYTLNYNSKNVLVKPRINYNSRLPHDFAEVCLYPDPKFQGNVSNFKNNVRKGVNNLIDRILRDLTFTAAIKSSFNNLNYTNPTIKNLFITYFKKAAQNFNTNKTIYIADEIKKRYNVNNNNDGFYTKALKKLNYSKKEKLEKTRKLSEKELTRNKNAEKKVKEEFVLIEGWFSSPADSHSISFKYNVIQEKLEKIKDDVNFVSDNLKKKYKKYIRILANKRESYKEVKNKNRFNVLLFKKANNPDPDSVFYKEPLSMNVFLRELVADLNKNNLRLKEIETNDMGYKKGFFVIISPNSGKSNYNFIKIKEGRDGRLILNGELKNKKIASANYVNGAYYFVYEEVNPQQKPDIIKTYYFGGNFPPDFEKDVGSEILNMREKKYSIKKIITNKNNYVIIYGRFINTYKYEVASYKLYQNFSYSNESFYSKQNYYIKHFYFDEINDEINVIYDKPFTLTGDYQKFSTKTLEEMEELIEKNKKSYSIFDLDIHNKI